MKNILILGSHGFLGANLIDGLERRYAKNCSVITLDRKKNNALQNQHSFVKKAYFGNFQKDKNLQRIFSQNTIDTVFHLICTTIPQTSIDTWSEVETNLRPTMNLIKQMKKHGVPRIIFFSSGGTVYGNNFRRHSETHVLCPICSYGAIKATIEKFLFINANKSNIMPLIVRLANPYGPHHKKDNQGFINIALRAAINRTKMQIWGNGRNRKDFIYVDDCINAILDLIEADAWGQAVNIGTGRENSLNEILLSIKKLVPNFTWRYSKSKSFDTSNFSLNIRKLRSLTSHRKFISLDKGIVKTHQWLLRQNINGIGNKAALK